jgi:ferredoxin
VNPDRYNRKERDPMWVHVDADICATTGQCVRAVPELFRTVEDGTSEVISAEVPEDLLDRVRTAARHCPVEAIALLARPIPAGGK